jgi:N-acetylmuramoyl-L-alanine amidase
MDVKIIGVKDARYQVLRGARVPAILIETGFLSNYKEERMLKNGYYRQKVAESILDGVRDYAEGLALVEGV